MQRASLALVLSCLAAGCGFAARSVSDATRITFDVPVIKPANFTNDRVAPLAFAVSITADEPTATLPADVPTDVWGPMVQASMQGEDAGLPPIFQIEVTQLELTADEPVPLHLAVSSRNDIVWGQGGTYDPPACSFSLDPARPSGNELGRRLELCVSDWVRHHGVPDQLELAITAGGTLPPGSSGEMGAFKFSWSEELHGVLETEMSCNRIKLDPAISDNGSYLALEKAEISGWGYSSKRVALGAFADIQDGEGKLAATAQLTQLVEAGERYWIISAADKTPAALEAYRLAGNIAPVLSPGMPDFPFTAVDALAGATGKGPGRALACWFVSGDAPRDGGIGLNIAGVGGLSGIHVEKGE